MFAMGSRRSIAQAEGLLSVYRLLRERNGHLGWWPGESRLEIIVGAILTQNTTWKNVETALAALKATRLLSLRALRETSSARIEQVILSCGYFRQKTKKLKAFIGYIDTHRIRNLNQLQRVPTARLREELLGVWGIGPETADSILLYAFERPVFVIDAYTKRVAVRHRWLAPGCSYDELQLFFEESLPREAPLYNDFHAQLVLLGKEHCHSKPRCEGCPLEHLL